MIKAVTRRLEDPKSPLLGPNIWMLKTIGMIMPKNKLAWCAYMLLHETVSFFVLTQFIEIYNIKSDMGEVLTNMKISMLSSVCVIKSNACLYWQKNLTKVIDYLTAADIEEREDTNEKRGVIIEACTKYCRKITYSYWVLVLTTHFATTSTPLLKYLTDTYFYKVEEESTEFDHIFISWVPFDKNAPPWCWVLVVFHYTMSSYGAASMMAFDVFVMVTMVFFGAKLDMLKDRCSKMFDAAGRDMSEDEANRMVRKMHQTYTQLVKYARMFNSFLSPVMFLYFINCGVVLSISAFQLKSATTAVQKVLLAEYVTFGIAQLFLFCWHSNIVLYKSHEVVQGLYESRWWAASVKQRRSLLLLAGLMNKPIIFTAGPFTNLTLSSFISILKGAYSYYTLLNK